jgi:hypothetical protein
MTSLELPASSIPPAPSVQWRDPATITRKELAARIATLRVACENSPRSADLRMYLGIAYAMNYEVYRSIDSLKLAAQLDPRHFLAQLKYAELYYRLRTLVRAEEETLKALALATNAWEASLARKQLQEIRQLTREGTQKPAWTKSLIKPALWLSALFVFLCAVVLWK